MCGIGLRLGSESVVGQSICIRAKVFFRTGDRVMVRNKARTGTVFRVGP